MVFQGQVIGLVQTVYSYDGIMLFVEFMLEMRQPFDFWKVMICAQTSFYVCYTLYGMFVCSYRGQFTVVSIFPKLLLPHSTVPGIARLFAALERFDNLFHDSTLLSKKNR